MKAILMSIKPQWVEKILNKEKTIEIRKRFPSDYVGWVYIYCTKDNNNLLHKNCIDIWWIEDRDFQKENKRLGLKQQPIYNGKVIARFWCDKVEEIKLNLAARFFTKSMNEEELLKQSCLTSKELENYLWFNICCGYAIHITKLEIFDKPKEISEFSVMRDYTNNCGRCPHALDIGCSSNGWCRTIKPLTRAPQSYQFIEI